jgi:hypothetical protein
LLVVVLLISFFAEAASTFGCFSSFFSGSSVANCTFANGARTHLDNLWEQ